MSIITRDLAVEIKARLWDGERQDDIADDLRLVSQGTVSLIKTGRAHGSVPWPDGSSGPLPHNRELELRRSRYRSRRSWTGPIEARQKEGDTSALAAPTISIKRAIEQPEEVPLKKVSMQRIREAEEDALDEGSGTRLTADEETAFEAAMRKMEGEEAERIRKAVTTVELLKPKKAPSRKKLVYEKHDWEYIKRVSPNNKWVSEAEQTDDSCMREAICIVFKSIPVASWEDLSTGRLIGSVMAELKKEEEI